MRQGAAKVFIEESQFYRYQDYAAWDDGLRRELIHGTALNMSPAPAPIHQLMLIEFSGQFYNFFKENHNKYPCQVFLAPFDVRFPEEGEDGDTASNVVQPDISIVCDKKKIDDKGCVGPPDAVIEILSPSTAKYDKIEKRKLYEHFGVREYWIVSPLEQNVLVYIFKAGKYGKELKYTKKDQVETALFPELKIDLALIFNDRL